MLEQCCFTVVVPCSTENYTINVSIGVIFLTK